MTHTLRLLITAGPTHEPIDAVRYLANRSSGRMGIAIAEAAAERGIPTTLLLGPTQMPTCLSGPPNSSQTAIERFQSTADLQRLLAEHWPRHDVLIMAAAVADYTPVAMPDMLNTKLRRTGDRLTLELQPTPDLLAELAATTRANQVVIGFALEPAERLIESARTKLTQKRLHAIVANPLETMDAETVTASVLLRSGATLIPAPSISKREFARWLVERLPEISNQTATR